MMKKKNILLFLILTITLNNSFSQTAWWEMMQDPDVNFYDVKNSFEDYWNGKTIEKGKGWKQFKRWEYFTEERVFPSGDRTQIKNAFQIYSDYLDTHPQKKSLTGQWTYIGNNFVPVAGGAGRVNCLAFHPDNSSIIFAGSPAGGLWKSTSGGSTWQEMNDQLASMGISSIVIHPQNPDTIFIGTGDGDGGDTYSVGVLKSTDGGQTFQTTGLNFSYQTGHVIRKLIMNPSDPDIILAATDLGIYRTDDGGNTWTQITTLNTFDLEFKPGDVQTVYATTGGRFYLSVDGGLTFTQITDGLPLSGMARVMIAVTPANASYVYILAGNSNNGFYGVYRSTDSGNTFSLRSDTPNILGWETDGSDSDGQAWYDLAIVASPSNANTIWTGGVNIWKSTDGGSNWQIDAHWYGGGGNPYVHADVHALEFIPGSNTSFLVGCDGGVFKTTNSGSSYSDISGNLKIAQIYKFSISPTDPYKMISGWQDNGTNLKTQVGYRRVLGGDGMDCAIDYTDDETMYGEYYYGEIYKSTDNGFNFSDIVQSNGTAGTVDEEGNWVTPFVLHPTNPNTILVGKTNVYRSTNGGNSWNTVGSVAGGSGMIKAIAYAPSDPNYIYALKSNKVFVSTNGSTFTDMSTGISTAVSLTNIAVDPNNPQRAWITYSGYSSTVKVYFTNNAGASWSNYSTGLPNLPVNCIVYENGSNDGLYVGTDMGVFYRNNSLSAWQYYSNGFPNTIVNDLEIYYATGKLRAATYGRGIWESDLYTNVANDASIAAVEIPDGNVCNTSFSPVITLKNSGDNDLISATIHYAADGNTPSVYAWTGMLHPGDEIILTLPVVSSSAGAHSFEIFTSLPNGVSDANTTNDTLQTNYTVITTGQLAEFSITPDCFGEEISWEIKNASNQIVYDAAQGTYSGNLVDPAVGGITITKNVCLDAGCYTFTIRDTEGNGMNGTSDGCSTNGTYTMYGVTGNVLFDDPTSNGNWGTNEVHNFCVTTVYAANFSATPTEICIGSEIQFNDLSPAGTNSWNWSFPGGNPSASSLQNPIVIYDVAGTYDVSLTTGNGVGTNSQTFSGYIVVNDSPSASVIFDSVYCFGNCDAMMDVTVAGGTSPFMYKWNTGDDTEDLENLCAGFYQMEIVDENGCRDTVQADIFTPDEIILNLNTTQASCGVADGMITSGVTGGIAPYDLLWSNGESTVTISGLEIGAYTLSVSDANDCVIENTVYISNPNAPAVIATAMSESCAGECDGILMADTTGGTGALNLIWNNGMGNADTITMVCPDTFIVSVIDANLCEGRDTVVLAAGTPYPVANFVLSDDTVAIGEIINYVNLSSGANQHSWDFGDGAGSTFSSTSHSYDSLGVYEVILVSCKNGCCDADTGYVYVMDLTSVQTISVNDRLKIYPNPAQEILILEMLNGYISSEVKLYDNNGKLVISKTTNERTTQLDISNLPSGIYFAEVDFYDAVLRTKVVIE